MPHHVAVEEKRSDMAAAPIANPHAAYGSDALHTSQALASDNLHAASVPLPSPEERL